MPNRNNQYSAQEYTLGERWDLQKWKTGVSINTNRSFLLPERGKRPVKQVKWLILKRRMAKSQGPWLVTLKDNRINNAPPPTSSLHAHGSKGSPSPWETQFLEVITLLGWTLHCPTGELIHYDYRLHLTDLGSFRTLLCTQQLILTLILWGWQVLSPDPCYWVLVFWPAP